VANKCGCGKRIGRGATHCGSCARSGGGYTSNMAAELAQAERERRAKQAAAELAAAKASEKRAAAQRKIAEKAAAAKKQQQERKQRQIDNAKRIADIKTARKISNARNKPEPQQPKKKGWW